MNFSPKTLLDQLKSPARWAGAKSVEFLSALDSVLFPIDCLICGKDEIDSPFCPECRPHLFQPDERVCERAQFRSVRSLVPGSAARDAAAVVLDSTPRSRSEGTKARCGRPVSYLRTRCTDGLAIGL